MTVSLTGEDVQARVVGAIQGSIESWNGSDVWVPSGFLHEVCKFAKEDPELGMDFLVAISAVDYIEYFELVYHMQSIVHNHKMIVKTKCWGRENPTIASVVDVWRGADLQEREIYDLMGITFTDHPNLKRILLWEGFPGHPHRKDYLEPPR
jgi:NADH-quinone oxidoreductase subunit C